jgi:hypothetical protein
VAGAWNRVAIPPVALAPGTSYWIAVLAPTGSGTVRFRDVWPGGGRSQVSQQTTLSALPATWTPGATEGNAPLSAYAGALGP